MILSGKRPTFRRHRSKSNPYRLLVLALLLIAGLFVLRAVEQDQIEPPFLPTSIPTRTSNSFALEGVTHFDAGALEDAILAYQGAVKLEPENAQLWADLARIQTYSSASMTTDGQRSERLAEALNSIDRAKEIDPDSSTVRAVRSFVLDWNANPAYVGDAWINMLVEAEQEARSALQLDNQNTLALAYYAEILVDEQALLQAEQNISEAILRDPDIMDVHRVDGYVRESLGYYGDAIRSYERAVEINPNLTFLYIRIGVNYRQLKQYDLALEYFAKAADINEQIGVQDPIPYLAIGNTYSQMGEFFIAARNVQKVLELDPTNPEIYGSLGMIYFKSRNYESAIPALKCATYGCNAEEACMARTGDAEYCETEAQPGAPQVIQGQPLNNNTVVYYYTYGSVLAGMDRPYNDYCDLALDVLREVRRDFADEPVIMQIVEASEDICAPVGGLP
jgi:tetratricopeptide (TPR) repeat protein